MPVYTTFIQIKETAVEDVYNCLDSRNKMEKPTTKQNISLEIPKMNTLLGPYQSKDYFSAQEIEEAKQ